MAVAQAVAVCVVVVHTEVVPMAVRQPVGQAESGGAGSGEAADWVEVDWVRVLAEGIVAVQVAVAWPAADSAGCRIRRLFVHT